MAGAVSSWTPVEKTSSGTIKSSPGSVGGLTVVSTGAGGGTASLTDGASTVVWILGAAGAANDSNAINFGDGIVFNSDIRVTITGSAKAYISYR